jgi:hypothetical protein
MAADEVGSKTFNQKMKLEKAGLLLDDAKDFMKNMGGKVGKYALLPAMGIGALGTIFGGRGELKETGQKEYSDGQKRHYGTGYSKRDVISSTQMKRPNYETTRITGSSRPGNVNYKGMPDGSSVNITDHTKNFDKYEIQEMVEKGW